MRSIFEHLQEVRRAMKGADLIALFLDYDGTLVPFADRPEKAVATNNLRRVLKALAEDPRCRVHIVSGRCLESLREALTVEGLCLVGLHGMQIEFPDGQSLTWNPAKGAASTIRGIVQRLTQDLGGEKGVYIEDKGLTVAVHYRLVSRDRVGAVAREFIGVVRDYDREGCLEIIRETETLEVRPRGWDKGKAVLKILKRLNGRILPIYIGDDATDEDAFQVLRDKGITVLVSEDSDECTAATRTLRDYSETQRFLRWMLKEMRRIN